MPILPRETTKPAGQSSCGFMVAASGLGTTDPELHCQIGTDFAREVYECISANYRLRTAPQEDSKGTMTNALADAMADELDQVQPVKTENMTRRKPSSEVF